ncbi:hypothetical protein [Mocis latipes granulovirus]|uniref:Uncharacterized protein n=1 Tax=Mocis latipes granulovirus TaxID=2072024 RepID=A0A162GWN9_9BBAC|nr:hypothetical protein [Mocis latipes granulovirus]AKR17498.1 hypothetical protein [Mocis latipes granulovirus]
MDIHAQELLNMFELWLNSQKCPNLRLLEELNDVVAEFLNKKISKYKKLREINEIFEAAMLLDTTESKASARLTE